MNFPYEKNKIMNSVTLRCMQDDIFYPSPDISHMINQEENLILTRLKVVCASEGGCNAKFFGQMHN